MAVNVVILLLCFIGVCTAGRHDIYAGYTVHGVHLRDFSERQVLLDLELSLDLDVWLHGSPGVRDAEVAVAPETANKFLGALDENGIQHYLKVADVRRNLEQFDEELASYRASRQGREALPFDQYPRYAEIDEYLERIAATYPDIVTLVNAGNSYEGRPIKYLRISTTNFTDFSKPVYFIDATMHAREWVTTPVALYSIHRLVEDLRDEDRDLLEISDWIIHPLVNPDGYEFTHTDDRMWRGTRSVNPALNTTCLGADPNRNYDVAFNTVGVSTNPCAQTYPGPWAFSEVETRIVRDIMMEHLDRIEVYLNIHSYGNLVIFGFGYDGSLPANGAQLHQLASLMGAQVDARKLPQAPFYMVGNAALLLYPTSGAADDYGMSIGIPFPLCLELPGYSYNFMVPPSYISQINQETWPGIAASARLARMHYDARHNY